MTVFFSLASAQIRDLFRAPFFLVLLLVANGAFILMPYSIFFAFRHQQRLLLDSGMSTLFLLMLGGALFFGQYHVRRPYETGLFGLLLTKPVGRLSLTAALFCTQSFLFLLLGIVGFSGCVIDLYSAGDTYSPNSVLQLLYAGGLLLCAGGAGLLHFLRIVRFIPLMNLALLVYPVLLLLAVLFFYRENTYFPAILLPMPDVLKAYVLLLFGGISVGALSLCAALRLTWGAHFLFLLLLSPVCMTAGRLLPETVRILPDMTLFFAADFPGSRIELPLLLLVYALAYAFCFSTAALALFYGFFSPHLTQRNADER